MIGGGIYALGPATLAGVGLAAQPLHSGNCADTNGLFAQTILTVTADSPFTYTDNLNLRGDLVVQGNVTFTADVATFSVESSGVTTHTLTGTGTTTLHDLGGARSRRAGRGQFGHHRHRRHHQRRRDPSPGAGTERHQRRPGAHL